MRRVAKAVGLLLLVVVLAVATLLYVLPNTRWGRERVRTLVLGALDGVIAGRVSIGAIEGPLYTGATLRDVVITDSAGAPFLRVPLVRARWSPRDLWAKRVILRDVLAERAEVVLDRPPGERWNWDRILFPDTTPATRGPGAQWGDHVVLRDLVLRDAHVVVRSPYDVEPWRSARARDSILAAAVAGETRTVVRRSGDGYQRITELRDVDARLPLLRIKEPGFVRQRYEIASARGTVLAFQPPPMLLRDARGVVELAGDSLWFSDVRTQLPATVATLDGRYDLATGALVLRGRADSLRTDDVRFLSPLLPTGGTGRIGTIRTRISGDTLGVVLDDLAIALDGGTARGRAGFGFVRDLLVFDSTRVRIDGLATRTMRRLLPDTTTVIPREGVLSGDVALDGPLTGVRLDASLRFADRRAGPIVLDARGTAGVDGEAVVARDLRLALAPVPVTIAGPSLATLGGRIGGTAVVNGRSDGWLASRLALTHTVDGRRSAVAGTARVALGGREPRVDVALGIDPLDLAVAGRFAPAAGLRGLARGSLSVQGPLSRLAVASRLGVDTAGAIALGGTVGVPTRGTPYADVRLTFDSLDLRRLLDTTKTNVPPTTLVGFADVDARGRDAASLTGTVEMQLRASDVDQIRIDTLALRARAGDGLLTLDTLAVWVGGTSVGAGGTFGLRRDRTGDLYVAAGIDSLARFAAYLPSDTGVVQPSQAVIDRVLARQRADSARIADSTAIPRLARGLPPVSTRIVPPPPIRRDSIDGAVRALA
ncbi:MAG: hypothetical protein MUF21_03890, partial [Gemmatimonadaceae bacterium]|nr:hypothetical protein [Gemmatimonadaceae bacterium]